MRAKENRRGMGFCSWENNPNFHTQEWAEAELKGQRWDKLGSEPACILIGSLEKPGCGQLEGPCTQRTQQVCCLQDLSLPLLLAGTRKEFLFSFRQNEPQMEGVYFPPSNRKVPVGSLCRTKESMLITRKIPGKAFSQGQIIPASVVLILWNLFLVRKADDVIQVEHWPSMCEVLSSIPSTEKKQKIKRVRNNFLIVYYYFNCFHYDIIQDLLKICLPSLVENSLLWGGETSFLPMHSES